MEQRITERIKEADMVLVGIGEEFSPSFSGEKGELEPYQKSLFYSQIDENHEIFAAYRHLQELLGEKPYFIVTMNTDDLIYRSALNAERIVAPCGSMAKMQCTEHIVAADEIRERVLAAGDPSLAVCPQCGKPLQFHTVAAEGYLEEGYLPKWQEYTAFLQQTLNRNLCIMELGVGFSYPQVVRFPFEKTAYYNKKATLIRVHSRFSQLPEELSGKGISIPENPVEFCNK
jgi:NAD-dependent SIR2 family protein deacetylase